MHDDVFGQPELDGRKVPDGLDSAAHHLVCHLLRHFSGRSDDSQVNAHSLGEVAELEPTYVDWIAKTITRDRDLVIRARVIQSDMDERGIDRPVRQSHAGFGSPGGPDV